MTLRRSPSTRGGHNSGGGSAEAIPADAILLQNGLDWIATQAGDAIIQGGVTVVEPTINAGQTFNVAGNAPNGTIIGTVAYSGVAPDGFGITGTGISISSLGVLTKTGALTAGVTTRDVLCTRAAYTSPPVSISVTVTAEAYSAEAGDNIIVGAVAWTSGEAVTTGTRRSNAGRFYEAVGSGTTGATAPVHTSGTASDGTVTWRHLCPIDYTSIASWGASITGTLSAPRIGILWKTSEITAYTGNGPVDLNFTGVTTSAVNYIMLKAKEEDAWYSHASPVFRYDPSKGVAIRAVGTRTAITINGNPYMTIKGLQLTAENPNTSSFGTCLMCNQGNVTMTRCIAEWAADNSAIYMRGKMTSNVFVKNHAGATKAAVILVQSGATFIGNTLVRPSNHAAGGVAIQSNYGSPIVTNNIVLGFTSAPTGTYSASSTNNAADNATAIPGSNKVALGTPSADFVQPSSASGTHDFRLTAGSAARNAGATAPAGAETIDALGTLRTVPWDVGAHEYA